MRNLKIVLLAAVLSFCVVAHSFAQGAGIKMGFVDLAKIFDEYGKTKDYDAVLAKKNSEYEAERNKKLDKIKDEQNKLAVLKAEEKGKVEEQIEKDKAELMEFDRQRQTDLRKERDEKVREILTEIDKVITEYAQKENYSLMFNDRILVFGDKTLDCTEPVIKILNGNSKPGSSERK